MSKKNNQYTGKAGHLFVMSRFLLKGWNVSIPEVDIGDDIFVVEDKSGDFRRVQVKTSYAKTYKNRGGYSVQFSISLNQIKISKTPDLYFCFVSIKNGIFNEILTIDRKELQNYFEKRKLGKQNKIGNINLRITFQNNTFCLKEINLTKFIGLTQFKDINH